jgi:hypothetical protein
VAAGGRQFWDRHVGDPAGWDRAGWQSHSRVRHDQGSQSRVGHQRSRSATESPRFGHDTSGQHRTGFGGGSGHGGQYGRDSGQRGGQSGDPRR